MRRPLSQTRRSRVLILEAINAGEKEAGTINVEVAIVSEKGFKYLDPEEIKKDLPDIPHVFFSSVANKNIDILKDHIWKEINS